uniref:Uncharacterized protein n=1 Tax=Anguilla anguilla TaxID=7936 RepID=A0A0E9R4Z3_ANGAN
MANSVNQIKFADILGQTQDSWFNKASSQFSQSCYCCNKALSLNPRNHKLQLGE